MYHLRKSFWTPQRTLAAIVLVFSFALIASWTSLSGRAAGSSIQSTTRSVPSSASRHTLAVRTGVVYPTKLPPATAGAISDRARRSRRTRKLHRRAVSDSDVTLPELPSLATLALITTPTVSTNFTGLGFLDSQCGPFCEPPSGQIAVGPSNIIEATNIVMRIFGKSGNVISTTNLNTLFGIDTALFSTDPRVAYDTISGRWFVSFLTFDGDEFDEAQNGFFNLAVSTSSDPTAGFATYSIETPGDAPDQESLGFNDDKVAQGANSFSCDPDCQDGDFEGNEFIIWNKSELLAGDPTIDTDYYAPGPAFVGEDASGFPIVAARSRSSTSTLWMISTCVNDPAFDFTCPSNQLNVWSVTGVPGVDLDSSATDTTPTIANINPPPVAPQKGASGNPIDTFDGRLLDAVYRDGNLWASGNSSCKPSGDSTARSCLQFLQILTGGSTPTVNQDFAFGTKNFYDYYPSVDLDNFDDLITSFTQSSSSEFPSAYVAARLSTDPANSLGTPVLFEAGSASYNSPSPESDNSNAFPWGDYSGAAVDPSDQTAVWVVAEFAATWSSPTPVPGSSPTPSWGTWIAEARVRSAASSPTPSPTPSATATRTTTATATATITRTPTASATATPTVSATPTASATPTTTATATSTATATPTVSATPTASPTPTTTVSPTPTTSVSPTPSTSPSPTPSTSSTPTATPTTSATPTTTDTPTATATSTVTATPTATLTTTPTATPTPPFGTLSVSGSLKFGQVKVNASRSKKLKVKNSGKFPLQVTIGTLSPPFSMIGSGTFTLAKKKTETVTVFFRPTAKGATTAQTLTITSDDPKHPSKSETASGSGK